MENLTVLGFSEAALTMIFDILESNNHYPDIRLINNLRIVPKKTYQHSKFRIVEKYLIDDFSSEEEFVLWQCQEKKFVIGAARVITKYKIRNAFQQIDIEQFINLINRNSSLSSTTELGHGVIINSLVCIAGQSKIENFVFINRCCSIGHHVLIGEFTTINPGVNIAGGTSIGKRCQIGIGACVIDDVKIGAGTIIGAGSVVTKDIPAGVVAYGNPCRVIREISDEA